MKTLKFNFSHSFKGNARINMRGKLNMPSKHFSLDSNGSNLIEIPLIGFENGSYKIVLNWEHGNQCYVHQQDFEIENQPDH